MLALKYLLMVVSAGVFSAAVGLLAADVVDAVRGSHTLVLR